MSKPIIKKEKSEYGSITLSFFNNGDGHHPETMVFADEDQLKALTNARSVTGRLFTAEDSADHHCQIGNPKLALETIENWIRETTDGKESDTGRRKAG